MPIIIKSKNESSINIQNNTVEVIDDKNKSSITAINKSGQRVADDRLKLFVNGERKTLNEATRKKLIELLVDLE